MLFLNVVIALFVRIEAVILALTCLLTLPLSYSLIPAVAVAPPVVDLEDYSHPLQYQELQK